MNDRSTAPAGAGWAATLAAAGLLLADCTTTPILGTPTPAPAGSSREGADGVVPDSEIGHEDDAYRGHAGSDMSGGRVGGVGAAGRGRAHVLPVVPRLPQIQTPRPPH